MLTHSQRGHLEAEASRLEHYAAAHAAEENGCRLERDGAAAIRAALATIDELEAERDKLQRFKDWVHAYLDQHGVPHHPSGPHGAEGCRIGDRMDWLMAGRDRLLAACKDTVAHFEIGTEQHSRGSSGPDPDEPCRCADCGQRRTLEEAVAGVEG